MTDLAKWLREQIDDDERVARASANSCWHVDYCDDAAPEFHKRFDEDRVLAEIAAKRAILDLIECQIVGVVQVLHLLAAVYPEHVNIDGGRSTLVMIAVGER